MGPLTGLLWDRHGGLDPRPATSGKRPGHQPRGVGGQVPVVGPRQGVVVVDADVVGRRGHHRRHTARIEGHCPQVGTDDGHLAVVVVRLGSHGAVSVSGPARSVNTSRAPAVPAPARPAGTASGAVLGRRMTTPGTLAYRVAESWGDQAVAPDPGGVSQRRTGVQPWQSHLAGA
jgi:hypothetical protein